MFSRLAPQQPNRDITKIREPGGHFIRKCEGGVIFGKLCTNVQNHYIYNLYHLIYSILLIGAIMKCLTQNNDSDGEVVIVLDVIPSQELQKFFCCILSVATKTDQDDTDQRKDAVDENQEILDEAITAVFHRSCLIDI